MRCSTGRVTACAPANTPDAADQSGRRRSAPEYVTYPKDTTNRIEPGFALGGPIARNKAWFFGAYQPAFTTNERQVNATTAVNPAAGTFDEDQKQTIALHHRQT